MACAHSVDSSPPADDFGVFAPDAGIPSQILCISTTCPAPFATCPGDPGLLQDEPEFGRRPLRDVRREVPVEDDQRHVRLQRRHVQGRVRRAHGRLQSLRLRRLRDAHRQRPRELRRVRQHLQGRRALLARRVRMPERLHRRADRVRQARLRQPELRRLRERVSGARERHRSRMEMRAERDARAHEVDVHGGVVRPHVRSGLRRLQRSVCGDGCETLLADDPDNCGACGKNADPGQACSGGTCLCPAGTTNCNGDCVDTSVDARNCGGCGFTVRARVPAHRATPAAEARSVRAESARTSATPASPTATATSTTAAR